MVRTFISFSQRHVAYLCWVIVVVSLIADTSVNTNAWWQIGVRKMLILMLWGVTVVYFKIPAEREGNIKQRAEK